MYRNYSFSETCLLNNEMLFISRNTKRGLTLRRELLQKDDGGNVSRESGQILMSSQ